MLELPAYRLDERRCSEGGYEFFDPTTERVVGTADAEVAAASDTGLIRRLAEVLARFRLFRVIGTAVAVVIFPFWLMGGILGLWPFHPKRARPRLLVRRTGDEQVVLTIRVSSGLLYDSRIVSDGQGRPVAQFRSHFKAPLRRGFGIIDLRGLNALPADTSTRPWLGCVEASGKGYRLSLVGARNAGQITPRTTSPEAEPTTGTPAPSASRFDVHATPTLRDDATSACLLIAATLAIAWQPPFG